MRVCLGRETRSACCRERKHDGRCRFKEGKCVERRVVMMARDVRGGAGETFQCKGVCKECSFPVHFSLRYCTRGGV